MRRIHRALIAFVTAISLAGCAPFYSAVHNAVVQSQETRIVAMQRRALQEVLGRRFRPQLAETFLGSDIGQVQCFGPPDMGGSAISRCSIAVGNQTVPILAQINRTDDHLNAALALAFFRRAMFEKLVSVSLYSAYRAHVSVSCKVPRQFIAPPGFKATCIAANGSVGKRVTAFVLDTFGWTQAVATSEPPDESQLGPAVKHDARHVPGHLVARIIAGREQAVAALLHSGESFTDERCAKTLELANAQMAHCEVKINGQQVRQRVMFANDRLTFRIEGVLLGTRQIEQASVKALHRHFHAGNNVHVTVNCGDEPNIVLTGLGYHWCEIQAPKGYPKRLVLAELDEDGHYDAFYSNYSQAAADH